MKKIGIFYGSTTGTTEDVADQIASDLGIEKANIQNVGKASADAVDVYDFLFLGSSTWGIGELQDDWYGFLEQLKKKNLSGKTVAIFGTGDGSSFASSFCDAIGIIYNELQNTGCRFTGKVSDEGYSYDSSVACIDGEFIGLPLDDVNESHLTDSRVSKWLESIKSELN